MKLTCILEHAGMFKKLLSIAIEAVYGARNMQLVVPDHCPSLSIQVN